MVDSADPLWAPWRMDYLTQLSDDPAKPSSTGDTCFLCAAGALDLSADQQAQRLVLHETQSAVLLLNRYPYANGHLLAAPKRHVADLSAMTPEERASLMELAEMGCAALSANMNPNGFNVGMNIGVAGGAAVPGHAHLHVVPRWNGDTNFMRVVGQTRVIPQALETSYQLLKDWFDAQLFDR